MVYVQERGRAGVRGWDGDCCYEGFGDRRDLHRVERRQRQMCIRDEGEIALRAGTPMLKRDQHGQMPHA